MHDTDRLKSSPRIRAHVRTQAKLKTNAWRRIWRLIGPLNGPLQMIAAIVAAVTFLTWLAERPIRLEENLLRRVDLQLKMREIVDASRGKPYTPALGRAVGFLQDPQTGISHPCNFDWSGLQMESFVFSPDRSSCQIALSASLYFRDSVVAVPNLRIRRSDRQENVKLFRNLEPVNYKAVKLIIVGRLYSSTIDFTNLRLIGSVEPISSYNSKIPQDWVKKQSDFSYLNGQSASISGLIDRSRFDVREVIITNSLVRDLSIDLYQGDYTVIDGSILKNLDVRLIKHCKYIGENGETPSCIRRATEIRLTNSCRIGTINVIDNTVRVAWDGKPTPAPKISISVPECPSDIERDFDQLMSIPAIERNEEWKKAQEKLAAKVKDFSD